MWLDQSEGVLYMDGMADGNAGTGSLGSLLSPAEIQTQRVYSFSKRRVRGLLDKPSPHFHRWRRC